MLLIWRAGGGHRDRREAEGRAQGPQEGEQGEALQGQEEGTRRRHKIAAQLKRLQGGPSGRGQPFVGIQIRVALSIWSLYCVAELLIWSQQTAFRDQMGHPVEILDREGIQKSQSNFRSEWKERTCACCNCNVIHHQKGTLFRQVIRKYTKDAEEDSLFSHCNRKFTWST